MKILPIYYVLACAKVCKKSTVFASNISVTLVHSILHSTLSFHYRGKVTRKKFININPSHFSYN